MAILKFCRGIVSSSRLHEYSAHSRAYRNVPSSTVGDGTLVVKTQNSGSVGSFCSPQYVRVTVSYSAINCP